jgi:hypothetical protein
MVGLGLEIAKGWEAKQTEPTTFDLSLDFIYG